MKRHKWLFRLSITRTIINLLALAGLVWVIFVGIQYGKDIIPQIKFTGVPLFKFKYIGEVEVTAYANRPKETDSTPNITSIGERVRWNTVAVSQNLLKEKRIFYGDIIWIEELQEFRVVSDTMNARIKNRFDVFYFDFNKVDTFGVKKCHIYLVGRSK